MSALADRIAAAKGEGRSALIAYLPVGYPDVDGSIAAMTAAVDGGADVIEIGVPYSDPGMDGPVIQQAVDVAVRAGVGIREVLRAVEAVAAAGATGMITPDLIPDEAAEWIAASDEHAIYRTFLVSPSSTAAGRRWTTARRGTRGRDRPARRRRSTRPLRRGSGRG